MLKVLRSLFTLALLLAAGVALAAAEVKPYARDDLASDVVRLTDTLRKETAQIGAKLKGKSVEQLRKDAASAVAAGNYKDAGAWLGAVVAADPKDSASWLALAKLGAAADDAQATGRYDLVERGQTAAYAAYQRATGAAQQAEALALLGNLFARHEMWRPALDAYRASLDRHDDEDARKIYEDMREKHGFRIVDYKVDNESSAPRICFNFSESLARKTDFTPYVAVAGAADTAISAEDQQICVEGVKHGERYAIVLRQGLPSAVGEVAAQGRGLRGLRARPLAAGAFRRPRLCAAAPGPARRAADDGQHRESVDRRLSHRRPQSARRDRARRLPQADHHLARERDRVAGRRQGVERDDGRRLRTQPGRRHRFPDRQGGRQARPRRLSRHRAAVEGRERAGGDQRRRPGRASSRRNGWSSPTSA